MTWFDSRIVTAEPRVAETFASKTPLPLVVALGSNLEDRLSHLRSGLESLDGRGVHIEAVSRVFETPPVGYIQQPRFYNIAALARTRLPPSRLLSIFKSVEDEAGRRRDFRNGPRTRDVDLNLLGDMIDREEV